MIRSGGQLRNYGWLSANEISRLLITVSGKVQGVGFRPYVYRLARRLALAGRVSNTAQGAVIEVEGLRASLISFLEQLTTDPPPLARITDLHCTRLNVAGYHDFRVDGSTASGPLTAVILPDAATCPDCVRDISDPDNRRFRYPFTNCTNCGPRYSIIEALPYDREHTSMRAFTMCKACQAEYESPSDRRFHAQPNACPDCGPHLELWDRNGEIIADLDRALSAACENIRNGYTVALKGLGGFQLIVDARNDSAIRRLRERKSREEKPLAVMYPSLESARRVCEISEAEGRILTSYRSPIVLLRRRAAMSAREIAPSVARETPFLGIMLPYTPLHHLMMADLGFPVVATSGNLSDEPICIDELDALERLNTIADVFLVHNRPIVRQVDDSVVHMIAGQEQVLRSARSYAPTPLHLPNQVAPAVAVGGHLKNTTAVASANVVCLSQHIGDLDTVRARDALGTVTSSLMRLYDTRPSIVIHDKHPDYGSSHYARESRLERIPVQHHYAHILSCMLDNEIDGPVLGVAWDGTGLGDDGTMWGGEFLAVDDRGYSRIGHMRRFRLPGGEAAIREPGRSAAGMIYETFGEDLSTSAVPDTWNAFTKPAKQVILRMISSGINSPITSSVGRMFDAVASLLNVCHLNAYEGQAAMAVGFLAEGFGTNKAYPYLVDDSTTPYVLDWRPMLRLLVEDLSNSMPRKTIAVKFHNTLVEMIVDIARRAGERRVVLSGGCFQNRYLTEHAIEHLRCAGFEPYCHHRIPPNDGGIAAGQILALSRLGKGFE